MAKIQAIEIAQPGGIEVMRMVEKPLPPLAANEAHIRHEAIGLNFLDVYHRSGLYPLTMPSALGSEAAGVVLAVGSDVRDIRSGDRVAYCGGVLGAYATERNIDSDKLVVLPDWMSFEQAASVMLQGLTVQYLLRQTFVVKPGMTILLHAAAGGLGMLAAQWANGLGARVIGTVGSEEKAVLARRNGCAETILYNDENFSARVRELTDGAGVPVVYDSIGKSTFLQSLDCLAPCGLMVSFGNSSGVVPAFELTELSKRGSLFITRPSLTTYTPNAKILRQMSAELFAEIDSGRIKLHIGQTFRLNEIGQAHTALMNRQTMGSTVILP